MSHDITPLSLSDKKTELLYKTEMCRNWQEIGQCRYGKKCCFAHGIKDMKMVIRHSKYKTQICRTYHLTGTCSYGVRCTFIHQDPQQPHIPVLSESSSSSTTSASSTSSSPTPAPTSPTAYYHTTIDYTDQPKMAPAFARNASSASASASSSSSITAVQPPISLSASTSSSSSSSLSSWLVTTNPGFSSIWLTNNTNNGGGNSNSDISSSNNESEFWQAGLHLSSKNIW